MSIDWANVSWVYVTVLAVFVFLSSLVSGLLTLRHHLLRSVLAAVLFAAIFVFWTYYPHNMPLPTRLAEKATPAPAVPTGPAAPQQPANPTQDATTPKPNQ